MAWAWSTNDLPIVKRRSSQYVMSQNRQQNWWPTLSRDQRIASRGELGEHSVWPRPLHQDRKKLAQRHTTAVNTNANAILVTRLNVGPCLREIPDEKHRLLGPSASNFEMPEKGSRLSPFPLHRNRLATNMLVKHRHNASSLNVWDHRNAFQQNLLMCSDKLQLPRDVFRMAQRSAQDLDPASEGSVKPPRHTCSI